MDPEQGNFQVSPGAGAAGPAGGGPGASPHPFLAPSPIPKIVANYNGTTKKIQMVPGRDIHWPGNAVPSDVPPCGFEGTDPQCRKGEGGGKEP